MSLSSSDRKHTHTHTHTHTQLASSDTQVPPTMRCANMHTYTCTYKNSDDGEPTDPTRAWNRAHHCGAAAKGAEKKIDTQNKNSVLCPCFACAGPWCDGSSSRGSAPTPRFARAAGEPESPPGSVQGRPFAGIHRKTDERDAKSLVGRNQATLIVDLRIGETRTCPATDTRRSFRGGRALRDPGSGFAQRRAPGPAAVLMFLPLPASRPFPRHRLCAPSLTKTCLSTAPRSVSSPFS
jgi:hypothetical protein